MTIDDLGLRIEEPEVRRRETGNEGPQAASAFCEPRRQASKDNKLLLVQRMEDSGLRQLRRVTMVRIKLRTPQSSIANRKSTIDNHQGALTHKDVKNEECSSEFNENKGARRVLLMT
ncbi:MAG: hypothetical protein ABSA59_00335 [Terriglobia bacterium]